MIAETETRNSLKPHTYVFLFIVVLFFTIYSPTVFTPYFHVDDTIFYNSYYQVPLSQWQTSTAWWGSVRGGRPLTAVGLYIVSCLLERSANDDRFFIILRLINLSMVIIACAMFAIWLRMHLKDKTFALLITLLIFFLPSYQVPIGQASPVVTLYSFPWVIAALWLLGFKQPICRSIGDLRQKKVIMRMSFSAWLLIMASSCYQLYPLFFLNGALIIFIFGKYPINERRIIVFSHILVFFVAMIAYMVIIKCLLIPIAGLYFPPILGIPGREAQYPLSIKLLVSNMVGLFSGMYLYRLANLWVVSMNFIYANFVCWFAGITFLLLSARTSFRFIKSGCNIPFSLLLDVTLFTLIFIGVNAVNIMLIPNYSYRGLGPGYAWLVVIVTWSIVYWIKLLGVKFYQNLANIILAILVIITGWLAQYNTYKYFALQSNREILFLEAKIEPFLAGKVDEIKLIRPVWNTLVLGDEHSRLNTGEHRYVLEGMLKYLYKKNGIPAPFNDKELDFAYHEGPLVRIVRLQASSRSDNSSVEVDMNYFLHHWGEYYCYQNLSKYTVKSTHETGPNTVDFAFDGRCTADSFWEVSPFPIAVEILGSEPFRLNAYTLVNVDSIDRMPLSWQVEGRSLSGEWILLDVQNNVPHWKVNEQRTYKIANPCKYERYRITFTTGMSSSGMRMYEIILSAN